MLEIGSRLQRPLPPVILTGVKSAKSGVDFCFIDLKCSDLVLRWSNTSGFW